MSKDKVAAFDGEKYRQVWQSLSLEIQDEIADKARRSEVSCSAIMRHHYPELWEKVVAE